ncbi:MAG: single-stranded-DNA-specific exonuclease RecJ [bacterium]|nr:single-stranded-DNA-specific exonuclease RecJ [bacterium]
MYKKWIVPECDRAAAMQLAQECNADPLVCLIALTRGYSDFAEFEEFISQEPYFCEPFLLGDIEKAAGRIQQAVDNNQKIAVYGDYDCDGITATAMLVQYLRGKNADVIYCIPDREIDGYGMNSGRIRELADKGVKLIITVDNGINSIKEVELAKQLSIDVVITDHHLPAGQLPDAVAVVDPHRDLGNFFKEVSGVFVAYKLLCVLENKQPEEMVEYSDLAALGTVSDVMPLVNENRTVVREGLKLINADTRPGIVALREVSGLKDKEIAAGSISFALAPRINSAGRVAKADFAVDLLLEEDYATALKMAQELNEYNIKRQQIEKEIFESVCKKIDESACNNKKILVASGENWHSGVIGIVASKLVERYAKPAVVLSVQGDIAYGSGRSVEGLNLFKALEFCGGLLERFGGHEMAAGLAVKTDKIKDFEDKLHEYAVGIDIPFSSVKLDCKLNPAALSCDMVRALDVLQPYGVGNPRPVFGLFNVKIEAINPIGENKHLKIKFSRDGTYFYALMFRCTREQWDYPVGETVDLAVTIDINSFNNTESVSVTIKDVRKSGIDWSEFEQQLNRYNQVCAGKITAESVDKLIPTRRETAILFRYLAVCGGRVSVDRAVNALNNELCVGKLLISADILTELGILKKKMIDSVLYLELNHITQKADFDSSLLLKRLNEVKGDNNGG